MKKNVTKRLFTLLLAAMLVFPLASCGGEYSEANEPEPNTSVVSIPPETSVSAPVISTTKDISDENNKPGTELNFVVGFHRNVEKSPAVGNVFAVFKTEEEMADYYSYMETGKYNEFFGRYDAQFYSKKQLLVIAYAIDEKELNNLDELVTAQIEQEKDELVVTLNLKPKQSDTNGQTTDLTALLAIDKDIFLNNPEDIRVVYTSRWLPN